MKVNKVLMAATVLYSFADHGDSEEDRIPTLKSYRQECCFLGVLG